MIIFVVAVLKRLKSFLGYTLNFSDFKSIFFWKIKVFFSYSILKIGRLNQGSAKLDGIVLQLWDRKLSQIYFIQRIFTSNFSSFNSRNPMSGSMGAGKEMGTTLDIISDP